MSDWNGFAKIIFNVVYIFDKCYWNTQKKSKLNQKRAKTQETKIEKQKMDSQTEKQKNWKPKGCMHVDRIRVVDHIFVRN